MTQRATKYQVRIIAGSLRGRKLNLTENPALRPMTDRVRAAMFSILGNAIPNRPFFDVFAGSGAVGLEAFSRGASHVTFVEKDRHAVQALEQHLSQFGLAASSLPPTHGPGSEKRPKITVLQSDAYRWGDKGLIPAEPATFFLGPPYKEFDIHFDALKWLIVALQEKAAPDSVLVVQSDETFPAGLLPQAETWDVRAYGRTQLAFWNKPLPPAS
jgi:16S rRNA (guanine(966)-N(2))-methyltransferase RsmD